jgi:hypothetical protein
MRDCSNDDIIKATYCLDYVISQFETDLYHDVYYSWMPSGSYYDMDLRAMRKFETLNPDVYTGLLDRVTDSVMSKLSSNHPKYSVVVNDVNKYMQNKINDGTGDTTGITQYLWSYVTSSAM